MVPVFLSVLANETRESCFTHELAEYFQLCHKGNVASNARGAGQHQRCGV